MRQIDGIVFDKDGTLFDFEATWTPWASQALLTLSKNDRTRAEGLGQAVGFDLTAQKFDPKSIVIAGTPEDIVAEFANLMPEYSETEIVQILNKTAENAPMVETVPLVPYLSGLAQSGLKLGVATNDAEAPARAHLSAVGAVELFDFIVGSDSGYGGKPAAGQLFGFCEVTGIAPERAAMVGDSLHDLMAGKAAGFLRVGVLTGLATREELEPHADVVLDNIGDIPAWLA